MSEAEKYQGLDWIKLPDDVYWSDIPAVEKRFLINKVRELAAKIDILNANLRIYTHAVNSQQKQYYNDRDYLPYEEDDRR